MTATWRATERFRAANFCGRGQRGQRRDGRPQRKSPWNTGNGQSFRILQQVRREASKVIWPTRRETLVTTGLVLLMVLFASLFFVTVDEVLRLVGGLVFGELEDTVDVALPRKRAGRLDIE